MEIGSRMSVWRPVSPPGAVTRLAMDRKKSRITGAPYRVPSPATTFPQSTRLRPARSGLDELDDLIPRQDRSTSERTVLVIDFFQYGPGVGHNPTSGHLFVSQSGLGVVDSVVGTYEGNEGRQLAVDLGLWVVDAPMVVEWVV